MTNKNVFTIGTQTSTNLNFCPTPGACLYAEWVETADVMIVSIDYDTLAPSNAPTIVPSLNPTNAPVLPPTQNPSQPPTLNPSMSPTKSPTSNPTPVPTKAPSKSPTVSTAAGGGGLGTNTNDENSDQTWMFVAMGLGALLFAAFG